MPKSAIIACAPSNGRHTQTITPRLPVKPADIAAASVEAAETGVSTIHLRARDPETAQTGAQSKTFMKSPPITQQSTDAVANIPTDGGLGKTMVEPLRAATAVSPEMASLGLASINFGMSFQLEENPNRTHGWEAPILQIPKDCVRPNTFVEIEYAVKELGEKHGTNFKFETYEISHFRNLARLAEKGSVKPSLSIQMTFRTLSGMGVDPNHLPHMHNTADKRFGTNSYEWLVLAAGRNQMPFATQSAFMGGNLRVGLEDSSITEPGDLIKSNPQQVRKIRKVIKHPRLTVAPPAEARERRALKGSDIVNFRAIA